MHAMRTETAELAEQEMSTPADLARLLQLSERSVRRLCADHRIPHRRIGNRIRFTSSDVEAALEQAFVAPVTS